MRKDTTMKQFSSIEKLDRIILYALELASSVSILLLGFGLIVSMANVLREGGVISDYIIMQRIWAVTQCVGIDASGAGTIIRTFQYHQEGEKVKTWLYALLSVLLLFTAAIVLNIESVQQTLNITLEKAYIHVFVPVEALIWIRSVAIVLLIVAHAMRHVQIAKKTEDTERAPAQTQETQPVRLEITPDLIEALRQALGVRVVEEAPETAQIPERTGETETLERELKELDSLLPDISLVDITAVVTAYRCTVSRREICSYLKWGGAKYTKIVKPILDAYEQLKQQK